MLRKRLRAFTLIELLIVVAIIGILAVALVPRITGSTSTARDAARTADLAQISTALELYNNDVGGYPDPSGAGDAECLEDDGTADDDTYDFLLNYMSSIPADPSGDTVTDSVGTTCVGSYYYTPVANGYVLMANLEDDTVFGAGKGYYEAPSAKPTSFPLAGECVAAACASDAYYAVGR
jgi:type II secretion system protein G